MTPEQLQGRPVGPRADLFSAGVVLWELLAGQPLFGELDELDAMIAICEGPRVHLRAALLDALQAMPANAIQAASNEIEASGATRAAERPR